jgi:hypothetical protein
VALDLGIDRRQGFNLLPLQTARAENRVSKNVAAFNLEDHLTRLAISGFAAH